MVRLNKKPGNSQAEPDPRRKEGQDHYVYRIRSSTLMVWVELSSVVMECTRN